MQLEQELLELRRLRVDEKEKKDVYETAKHERKSFERTLYEYMDDRKIEGQRVDGTTFSPVETTYSTVQDRAAFIAWAEENAPELVEPKERSEILNQIVREKLDNGEPLPPGVGYYVREYIAQRAG